MAFFSKQGWIRPGSTRIKQGVNRQDDSLEIRELATKASLEMLSDVGTRGEDARSFRFLFPIYQQRYPQLGEGSMIWLDAHNDIVQFPIELGIAGTLLLVGFGVVGVSLVRSYFWENPLSASITLGAALLLVYAWWDFPFQAPAILTTWCALLVSAAMWAQFEEQNIKG